MACLLVKVIPGAARSAVVGWEGERLRVRIAAPPERGKANEALIRLLSSLTGLPKSAFTLIAGETSRIKQLRIDGVTDEELRSRLHLELPE